MQLRERAIVIGAGLAGLLGARVLANYFKEVVLLEKDELPPDALHRKAVPQGQHLHSLMTGGLEAMQQVFPGLAHSLNQAGGRTFDINQWYALSSAGKSYRISRPQPTPLPAGELRVQSRPLLELCLRDQLEARVNVVIRPSTRVHAPMTRGDKLVGVIAGDHKEEIPAELVLDCSGPNGLSLRWLTELGYDAPPMSQVHCDIAYSTALIRPDPEVDFGDAGFLIGSPRNGAHQTRGGSLLCIEEELWQTTLVGRQGDYPPTTIDGFKAFAETLQHPALADILERSEFISAPQAFRFPVSRLRHFESLERFPRGLLVMGDIVCQVNPGYGQGMSSAARQALALAGSLAEEHTGDQLWHRFFEYCYQQVRAPWLFAALSDFSRQGTTGDYPDEEKAIAKLGILNRRAAGGDLEAGQLLDDVFDLRQPLSALEQAGQTIRPLTHCPGGLSGSVRIGSPGLEAPDCETNR